MPKSVTPNDPEPRISGLSALFAFSALVQPGAVDYFSKSTESSPLTVVIDDIRVITIFARDHP